MSALRDRCKFMADVIDDETEDLHVLLDDLRIATAGSANAGAWVSELLLQHRNLLVLIAMLRDPRGV